jgi:hypothetical protein
MKHGYDRVVYTHNAKEDLCIDGIVYEIGEVLYVGSGSIHRVYSKTDRRKSHLAVWDKINFVVVHEGLSKEESLIKEQELLDEFIGKPLLNVHRTVFKNTPIIYDEIATYFYLDEVGYLRCKQDVYGGIRMKILVKQAGDLVGNKSKFNGYWSVRFKGKTLKLHRVVWVLHNKVDLDSNLPIDHIDRNKDNNLPENLRLVSHRENSLNKHTRLSNIGLPRISYSQKQKLFHIQWTVDGKKKHKYFTLKSLIKAGYPPDEAFVIKFKEASEFLLIQEKAS